MKQQKVAEQSLRHLTRINFSPQQWKVVVTSSHWRFYFNFKCSNDFLHVFQKIAREIWSWDAFRIVKDKKTCIPGVLWIGNELGIVIINFADLRIEIFLKFWRKNRIFLTTKVTKNARNQERLNMLLVSTLKDFTLIKNSLDEISIASWT